MAFENEKNEVRDLRDGEWYWIDKKILSLYGQRLKPSGIAVYNALASFANSETQACFPTQKAIAKLIGSSARTVIRKIRQLRELGLVRVEKKRGSCLYYLLEPKVTKETPGCDKKNTSEVTRGRINNNYLTRIINNINIGDKKFSKTNLSLKSFRPKTREELLALDLARALNDPRGFSFYLSYAKKYPESLLRQVLGEVKEVAEGETKKGRAALFNHLIQKYVRDDTKYLSN